MKKIREAVFDQVYNSRPLCLKLALSLGMSEQGVKSAAKRKSKSLLRIPAPDVIKQELHLTDEEMFESQIAAV